MRSFIAAGADYLESFCLRYFSDSLARVFTNAMRGQYAGYNLEMYQRAARWLDINCVTGDVAEFGVGSGATFLYIFSSLGRYRQGKERRYFLFDSFEGLPEARGDDAHPQWQKGAWRYDEAYVQKRARRFAVPSDRLFTVKGFYEKSLREDRVKKLPIGKLALVHIDCDLYSSTEQALDFITPHIQQGTVLLLDDYFCYSGDLACGEAGALAAWCKKHDIKAEPWFPYAYHGMSFIVTVRRP